MTYLVPDNKSKRKFKTYLIDEILQNDDEKESSSVQCLASKSGKLAKQDQEQGYNSLSATKGFNQHQKSSASTSKSSDRGSHLYSSIFNFSVRNESQQQQLSSNFYYNYFYQALMSSQSNLHSLSGSETVPSTSKHQTMAPATSDKATLRETCPDPMQYLTSSMSECRKASSN